MEAYKKEFIEFMVESEIRRFHTEKRKKISILHECRSICDRFSVKETG